jgi:hypothetical protein
MVVLPLATASINSQHAATCDTTARGRGYNLAPDNRLTEFLHLNFADQWLYLQCL